MYLFLWGTLGDEIKIFRVIQFFFQSLINNIKKNRNCVRKTVNERSILNKRTFNNEYKRKFFQIDSFIVNLEPDLSLKKTDYKFSLRQRVIVMCRTSYRRI